MTGKSLLRTVSPATVRNQFNRLALGGARLSAYSFSYTYPSPRDMQGAGEPPALSFSVLPESQPPTNVHVIIGSNGVGKSRLLNRMENVLVGSPRGRDMGAIEFAADEADQPGNVPIVDAGEPSAQFANLVSVAFSAFDDFEPVSSRRAQSRGLGYAYIGLKKIERSGAEDPIGMKDPRALAVEFGNSVRICLQGARVARWRRTLDMLESDPIFAEAEVASLAEAGRDDEVLRARARDLFCDLSSGHKIVLLTVTRLVESVEERTLVCSTSPRH